MKMKRMLLWTLSLMLAFMMIPSLSSAVYAEEGNGSRAISIGAGNIEKGNKVYMGVRLLGSGPFTEDLISWIILGDANSSDLKDSSGNVIGKDHAKLLITEKMQGFTRFNSDENPSNVWQDSEAKRWCSEFVTGNDGGWNQQTGSNQYQAHFTESERSVMLSTSKTDAEYFNGEVESGASSLVGDQMFFLSAEEAFESDGYFNGDDSRIAYLYFTDEIYSWWLRSPLKGSSQDAISVSSGGAFMNEYICRNPGARPAFNIDLRSILFTSAAEGGKSSGTVGANALKAVSDKATKEWKLTLKDAGRSSFEAHAAEGAVLEANEGYSGWTVPVTYSGAETEDSEYVSVILCDSKGKALYYGNIAKDSAASSGSGQDVAIPEGLAAGSYTMYVFNEQINGDKRTDYASEFHAIELKVNSYPPGGQTTPMSIRDAKVVLSESSYVYNGKVQRPAIVTIGGQILTAGTDYTAVWSNASSKDAGTYTVTITGKGIYEGTTAATYTISKAVNPLAVKGRKVRVNYKKLVKRTRKLNAGKTMTFIRKGKGRMKYKLTSAKKGKKSFLKNFRINARTGRIAIKKGLKRGTYKVVVKMKAAGAGNYKASPVKKVKILFKIK